VLIDRSHTGWGAFAMLLVGAAVALHLQARAWPEGAGGGSPVGLAIGAVALLCMLFALALGARKALVRWIGIGGVGFVPRLGSIEWWTKGHLWLGLAALPLALAHSGLRASGSLGIALVVLLVATVVTGIYGLVLQHLLPHRLSARERGQTTHEETGRRIWNLVSDAQTAMKKASDDAYVRAREAQAAWRLAAPARAQEIAVLADGERQARHDEHAEREKAYEKATADAQTVRDRVDEARQRVEGSKPAMPKKKLVTAPVPVAGKRSRASIGTRMAVTSAKGTAVAPEPSTLVAPAELMAFYDEVALPYLLEPAAPSLLRDELGAEIVFESIRQRIPEAHREALEEIRACCGAVRRKEESRVLFRALHSWLLLHVPLAVLLVILALVHAVAATRF
jgi:hypothetical protein